MESSFDETFSSPSSIAPFAPKDRRKVISEFYVLQHTLDIAHYCDLVARDSFFDACKTNDGREVTVEVRNSFCMRGDESGSEKVFADQGLRWSG